MSPGRMRTALTQAMRPSVMRIPQIVSRGGSAWKSPRKQRNKEVAAQSEKEGFLAKKRDYSVLDCDFLIFDI